MNPRNLNRPLGWLAGCVMAALLVGNLGGCPVDSEEVFTESLRAALQTATTSFVDALADYLATH